VNKKIRWEKVAIEVITDSGVVLKGVVEYWAKDYKVCLQEPFVAEHEGSHLMYAIPMKYVVEEELNGKIKCINIIPRAKEILKTLYFKESNNKKQT